MDLYKYACKFIIVPMWAKYERSPYLEHLKYLDKSQYLDSETISQIQWEKIRSLVEHSYKKYTLLP